RVLGMETRNEFDLIKQSFLHSQLEENHLRGTIFQQNPIVQANFLSRLIKGHLDSSKSLEEELAIKGIHFRYKAVCVILLEVDSGSPFVEDDSETEWELARFVISNLIQDLLSGNGYTVEMNRQRVAILLCLDAPYQQLHSGLPELRSFAAGLKNLLSERFQIEASMGAGNLQWGLANIGTSYKEAVSALDYKIIKGKNTITFFEEIQGLHQLHYYYPIEIESKLINAAKSGDYPQVEHLIQQIYEMNFLDRGITPDIGRCLVVNMLGTLLQLMASTQEPALPVEGENDPIRSILECSTVDEMLEKLKQWYASICVRVNESRSDQGQLLLHKMRQYIEEHCHDFSFSQTAMADHLGFTPPYLSTLFKKYTGKSIMDYAAHVRIAQAKRLLADRTLTVMQIASRVGYTSDIALIRVFKKIEGITPGKYRDSIDRVC
ncbi:MAG: transcriptional regulator, AraC family, partial [Paenibacillus sp.]|nr:transcriptional regulator, AraC family [Paenibacillus sp.]